ncbi:protein of unknown function [Nitrospira defluvii]|uniref:Lipoprotein n=1 Tax=Nitrospira defluvii TaxID=330214 RepID=D8PBR2_9BACT|nr:protein of unknown function [Nitrospira defluvii]
MRQRSRSSLAFLLLALCVSSGCQFFGQRGNLPTHYNLPLTVQLRMDQSIAAASLDYRDACGQALALPIRDGLETQLKKRMGQVFERVHLAPGPSTGAVDGVVDTALGFRQVDLFIPRKANKSYPATVTLGMEFSYTDDRGAVLVSKKLQSAATGEVEARAESCAISGLDKVAEEAAAKLVEGMAQQLGTATKIREQAQFRKGGDRGPLLPASVPPAAPAAAPLAATPAVPPVAGSTPKAAAPASVIPSGSTQLSFRTIIRDDNQNHVLEQRESFSVEFEVKNEGAVVAEGVEVELSGHAAIVGGLKSPVSLGTLQPGEVRRVAVDGKVGAVADTEQAELICALRASANVLLPSAKKFFVAIRPDAGAAVEVLSVDVDQLPSRNGKSAQPNSVGIAIGVGAFRDPAVPAVRFAAHDAEVMGGYFKTALGVPPQKVKVLSDAKALKDDLIEVFEQWLPKQGGPQATVYIYLSGRAVVDQETGVVSLLPYDGTRAAASRTFSLARLQRALTKASVKQAVLMLDLSLEPSSGSDPGRVVPPRWTQQDSGGEPDRTMLMIGNSGMQEAQAFQPGQHGLFTYFLLKGLRGAADLDKSGNVLTGELCAYVHGQVSAVTQTQAGNPQQTICLPAAGEGASLRGISVTKTR